MRSRARKVTMRFLKKGKFQVFSIQTGHAAEAPAGLISDRVGTASSLTCPELRIILRRIADLVRTFVTWRDDVAQQKSMKAKVPTMPSARSYGAGCCMPVSA